MPLSEGMSEPIHLTAMQHPSSRCCRECAGAHQGQSLGFREQGAQASEGGRGMALPHADAIVY